MELHSTQRPTIGKNFNELSLTLTSVFHSHSKKLSIYSEQTQIFQCHYPFCNEFAVSHERMILDILCYEFGVSAYYFFTHDYDKTFGKSVTPQCHNNYTNKAL